jgi:putative hydrolase of the HAD superfamily
MSIQPRAIQPTAIIFDYGNVLCGPQPQSELQGMARILDMPEDAFLPIYWRYRLPYDEARMDANSYWNQVASDCERTVNAEQIRALTQHDVQSWSQPSPVMVEWARQLRQAGLRTAVLSNMPMDLRVYLTDVAGWLPEFDHMTFSCDVRMVKPKPEIYEHCLQGLGVAASEALFLDDRPENIEAARQLGIHAIEFTTPAAAMAAMDGQYLLPVPIAC